jgi:ParB/RepB/Spo0J family partition protein
MTVKSKIAQAAEAQIETGFTAERPSQVSASTSASSTNTDLRAFVGKTISLPVDRLFVKDNVRKTFKKDDDYWALVNSIREEGLAQNLTGEPTEDGQRAALVSGQRRFFAAIDAGLSRVYVRLQAYDNNGKRIMQGLVENLLREELNAVDTADAFAALVEEKWTIEAIAARCVRSEQTIKKYLQIASWPDSAKNFVRENIDVFPVVLLFNQISKAEHEDHELLMAKLRNLLKRARETESVAKQPKSPEIDSLNQQRVELLKQLLGVKAAVSQKNKAKPIRVTLSFKDESAFEDFTRKLR